jgi:DNA topoisomerase-2
MAQNFVGSNNINLLEPNGQFGTRLHGGDDSASERYIFTMLNSLTRVLFPEMDDSVLTYLNDDGTIVEPEYYVPIIPFALINGISGIGTGFSCSIAPYNPITIIQYLRLKLENKPTNAIEFIPYYEGFKGTVEKMQDNKYLIRGVYEVDNDTVRITELPIGTWTMPYITYLETLMDGATDKAGKRIPPSIKDFTSVCTEVMVDITVVFPRGKVEELLSTTDSNGHNGLEKLLKLQTTVSTTNMHMFNSECKLHKYESVDEIVDDFYNVRINVYQKRKAAQVLAMNKKLVRLSNRARYIQETMKGVIDLRRKTAVQVNDLLTNMKFEQIEGDFKYLIKMPMDSVTEENVASIMNEKETTETELNVLMATTVEQMWLSELSVLEKEYAVYKQRREKIQLGGAPTKKPAAKKLTITRVKK